MTFNSEIVGNVVASFLEYDHLIKITGDPIIIDPKISSWIPADGRSIVGSELSTLTGLAFSPDLRGQFLRGLNQFFSPGEPAIVINDRDPDDRKRVNGYSYQKQSIQPHSHPITDPGHQHNIPKGGTVDGWGGFTVNSGQNNGNIGTARENTGITQTDNNKEVETRPNNIAVHYYIKIN